MGIRIPESAPLVGHRFSDLPLLFPDMQVLFALLFRDNRAIIPRGNERIYKNDLLYAMAEPDDIPNTFKAMGQEMVPARRS